MKPSFTLARQVKANNVEVGKPKIIRNIEKQIVTDERQVMETWRQYYREALNQRNDDLGTLEAVLAVSGPENEISVDEVAAALHEMKQGKSGGVSEVTTELLKAGESTVVEYLTKLFSQVWNTQSIPDDWRKGMIRTNL